MFGDALGKFSIWRCIVNTLSLWDTDFYSVKV